MRCYVSATVVTLAVLSGVTAQRDARFFHTRQFWDGFERGLADAGTEMQKRLNSNLETTMGHFSTLGKSIGELSRKIEHQVQDSLPHWMRDEERSPIRREGLSPEDAPIEAIEGTLGMDGLDDGLQVYFKGDSELEELPEPHIIPSDESSFSEDSTDAEVIPPPRTGGPLFDLRFGFDNRFPIFSRYPSFPMNPFFSRGERILPWWQGENVCKEVEEIDESEGTEGATEVIDRSDQEEARNFGFFFGQMEMKSCSETLNKYTCTTKTRRRGINRTVKEIYKCCHGFIREVEGCTEVNMMPLDESLETLGLTDFVSLCENAGVMDLLQSNNLTIFAPSNEAVQDFTSDLTETNELEITDNEVYRRKRQADQDQSPQIQEVVYSHMYDGFLYSHDIKDEQIIQSMATDSTIRINIYSQTSPPTITANCARVTKVNQHSSNGVIHTLDRVMQPAAQTIADIVTSDPQFSILKKIMSKTGMLSELREAGQMTLLAPTDAAFRSIGETKIQVLIDSSECLKSILQNHILPNVICSAAITSPEAKTINLLNEYLMVELHDTGKLFVEGSQIVAKDIMATNGVIHIIDKPIMPTEASQVTEILQQKNLTKFLELLHLADMKYEFDSLNDATVFAPSNEAIDRVDTDFLEELKKDIPRLQETLRYHVSKTPFSASEISNNHHLHTAAGHPLRVNLYRGPQSMDITSLLRPLTPRMQVTAGCGRVSMYDISRACGSNIHVIDSILELPKESVMERLENDVAFSIFSKLIKESSMADEISGDGPFTVLAPSDHVFKTLPEAELQSLMEDEELKENLVKRHILREHMCCSGIAPNTFPYQNTARTAHGSTVHLHQTPGGLLKAGSARITRCSQLLRNGLVHSVNSLYVEPHVPHVNLNPKRWDLIPHPNPSSDTILFKIPFLTGN